MHSGSPETEWTKRMEKSSERTISEPIRLKIFLTGFGDLGLEADVRQEGCVMMSTREQRLPPLLPLRPRAGDGSGLSPLTAIDSSPKCIPLVA